MKLYLLLTLIGSILLHSNRIDATSAAHRQQLTPEEAMRCEVAATWAIHAFHACALLDADLPLDFRAHVEKKVMGGVSVVKHYYPTKHSADYTAPIPLYTTFGFAHKRLPQQREAGGLVVADKRRRRVIVALRGTTHFLENVQNGSPLLKRSDTLHEAGFDGYLHAGYVDLFEGVIAQVDTAIQQILAVDKGGESWEILVTGHSLGGALATLIAPHLAVRYGRRDMEVHLISLGAPYVGYADFGTWATQQIASSLCFQRATDIAPNLVADTVGTRLVIQKDETLPILSRHKKYTKRVPVGRLILLPSYGHPSSIFFLSHSIRHYRKAIYAMIDRPYTPLFDLQISPTTLGFVHALVCKETTMLTSTAK